MLYEYQYLLLDGQRFPRSQARDKYYARRAALRLVGLHVCLFVMVSSILMQPALHNGRYDCLWHVDIQRCWHPTNRNQKSTQHIYVIRYGLRMNIGSGYLIFLFRCMFRYDPNESRTADAFPLTRRRVRRKLTQLLAHFSRSIAVIICRRTRLNLLAFFFIDVHTAVNIPGLWICCIYIGRRPSPEGTHEQNT